MNNESNTDENVMQSVPFFAVTKMDASIRYYVDGLGFEITQKWVVDDEIRWCWLQRGGAALMLQEFSTEGHDAWMPEGKMGEGVSVNFICRDAIALYHEFSGKNVDVETPFVGNHMWVIGLTDPDGYRLFFESDTDVPEETVYSN
jgi:catechol 2,3-dioxygenase-like lactoylglutathione lyase family enzyme